MSDPRATEPTSEDQDEAAFEAELAAQRRRGRLTALAVVVALALVVAGGWWLMRPELPRLDAEEVQKVRDALGEIDKHPEIKRAFAAQALAELESERLPSALREGLRAIPSAPPGMEGLLCGKTMANEEVAAIFTELCPAGPKVIADAMQTGDAGTIVRACEVEGEPFTAEEAGRADAGCVALGVTIWGYLSSKRAEQEIERTLLRKLVLGS